MPQELIPSPTPLTPCGAVGRPWGHPSMLKYFDTIWAGNGLKPRGLFVNVPSLLQRLKNFKEIDPELSEIKDLLNAVDIVIWDDISTNKASEYDGNQLLQFIDNRLMQKKANIFTSNADKDILDTALGNRLSSRIWNGSETIEFRGKDRRGCNND